MKRTLSLALLAIILVASLGFAPAAYADDASTDAISYVGSRYRSLIDHILVSRDVRLGEISGDDAAIVRLDQSVADFSQDISDHVPIVFRMIYRETPLEITGEQATRGLHIDVPEAATSLRISFESE